MFSTQNRHQWHVHPRDRIGSLNALADKPQAPSHKPPSGRTTYFLLEWPPTEEVSNGY
jgi:hypothetical protein